MQAGRSLLMLVPPKHQYTSTKTTWHHITEDRNLQFQFEIRFISHMLLTILKLSYHTPWNLLNNSLAVAINFKPGILCSLKMVHLYQNVSELCL